MEDLLNLIHTIKETLLMVSHMEKETWRIIKKHILENGETI